MKATRKRTKTPAPPLGLQAIFAAMQSAAYRDYFGPTTAEAFLDIPSALKRDGPALRKALDAAANREYPGNNAGPDGDQPACEVADVAMIASFWAGVTACWYYMTAINGKGGAQ